ncbi:MAG: hypothetical protein M1831_002329 [Alyxoria varia]|nr:MAG: hypothetical protein M1831_002329 [Alyxoria varia]
MIPLIAYSCTLAQCTYAGMGRHEWDYTKDQTQRIYFWIMISSEFYVLSLMGYKSALILLYIQLFGVHKKFRYACYGVMFYTLGYLLCNLITEVADCHPVEKNWVKDMPGHCVNTVAANIAYGFGHMSSDLIIAILPLPMIWRLQLKSNRERLGLAAVLSCGLVAFVVATIRYIYATVDLTIETDPQWVQGIAFLFMPIEVNTGLICGCTPALKPLFRLAKERSQQWSQNHKSSLASPWTSRKRSTADGDGTHVSGRRKLSLRFFSRDKSLGLDSALSLEESGAYSEKSKLDSAVDPRSQLDSSAPHDKTSRDGLVRNLQTEPEVPDTWDQYTFSPAPQSQSTDGPRGAGARSPAPRLNSDELFRGTGVENPDGALGRAHVEREASQGGAERDTRSKNHVVTFHPSQTGPHSGSTQERQTEYKDFSSNRVNDTHFREPSADGEDVELSDYSRNHSAR